MKKILLAYDGSEPAEQALETAAQMARLSGASVGVVSVVPAHPGRMPVDPWDDTATHARELLEARRLLRQEGIEAELHEPIGDPGRMIERVAEEGDYDTIVLGSRGLGTIGRALQGSVSEYIATHARATVVIAR